MKENKLKIMPDEQMEKLVKEYMNDCKIKIIDNIKIFTNLLPTTYELGKRWPIQYKFASDSGLDKLLEIFVREEKATLGEIQKLVADNYPEFTQINCDVGQTVH